MMTAHSPPLSNATALLLEDFESHPFNEVDRTPIQLIFSQLIYYSYMPFCVITGLIGNCMVWILIRSNRILARLPTNSYLLCLAAMSSIFLSSLFVFWIEQDVLRVMHVHSSKWGCKLLSFAVHFADFTSVWLIVLVGAERLVLLHRRCRTLSLERARAQIIVLVVLAVSFNSCIFYIANVDETDECDIYPEYEDVYRFFITFETIFCMALPSILILASNVLVVAQLRMHARRLPASPAVSFHTATGGGDSTIATSSVAAMDRTMHTRISLGGRLSASTYSALPPEAGVLMQGGDAKQKPARRGLRYTDIQLTRSLLIVTWTFILLNLPNYLFRITTNIFHLTPGANESWMQEVSLAAHMLLYTHHAFVFYLYIFYSPQMKRRLKPTALKLLECYCLKPDAAAFSDH